MGEIMMPILFFYIVVISVLANFFIVRVNSVNIFVRSAMLALSITFALFYFLALSYKAKQYQLSLLALQNRKRECMSIYSKQLIRSCRPNVPMMGSFCIIDQHLVLQFLFLVLSYTVTLLVTFQSTTGLI